jgi:hypothetical protein
MGLTVLFGRVDSRIILALLSGVASTTASFLTSAVCNLDGGYIEGALVGSTSDSSGNALDVAKGLEAASCEYK